MFRNIIKIVVVFTIICTLNINKCSAIEFDRNSIKYPNPYLEWLVDLYTIKMNEELDIKHLDVDVYTLGSVDYLNKSIRVSDRVKSEQRTKEIVYHEIGHIIDKGYLKLSKDVEMLELFREESKGLDDISKEYFVSQDIDEYVAECYMLFMEYPNDFKKKAPNTFEYLNNKFNNYYTQSKSSKIIGTHYIDIKASIPNKFVVENNLIVEGNVKYKNPSIILDASGKILACLEEEFIQDEYKRLASIYNMNGMLKSPDSLYVVNFSTYKTFQKDEVCTLLNFIEDDRLKDLPLNLFQQDEKFIKEKLIRLRELGY